MKPSIRASRFVIAAAIALAFLLGIEVSSTYLHAQTTSRQKFLYKAVRTQNDEQTIQTVLELFSRDGWEVVAFDGEFVIFKK